jgi:hypothetical protein
LPRLGKPAREGDLKLSEQPEGLSVTVQGMSAQVETDTLPHLTGRSAAQLSTGLQDRNTLPACSRNQGRRGQPGKTSANHNQIRERWDSFWRLHDSLLLFSRDIWLIKETDETRDL